MSHGCFVYYTPYGIVNTVLRQSEECCICLLQRLVVPTRLGAKYLKCNVMIGIICTQDKYSDAVPKFNASFDCIVCGGLCEMSVFVLSAC